MKFTEYIGSQFGNPRGIVGKICCVIMNVINRKMYVKASDSVLENSCKAILDVGFGNGYLEKRISKQSGVIVKGIDISEDMLKSAAKRNRKSVEQGRVILSLGDCCNLEFQDEMFDAVTSVNTIYFWPDTVKGLSEIKRVLKDNGIFVNAVYSQEWLKRLSYTKKGFKFFSKEDYISDGNKAGFSKVVIEEIVNGKSYLIK
ncbi:MAG: class I SAM-dependent methyltransferase, partial [Lachnospiraceae bacterium]|nr:class I SAM-dependent methyltransferase [Lachnospiraceae bacterium]